MASTLTRTQLLYLGGVGVVLLGLALIHARNERSMATAPSKVQSLAALLSDESPYARRYAAWSLAALGPSAREAVPALLHALKDREVWARHAAACALAQILGAEAKDAVPVLLEALQDKENTVARSRQMYVEALAGLGPLARETAPALRELLQDENQDVRKAAGDCLELIESKETP
jgi:HEAT repeat protein